MRNLWNCHLSETERFRRRKDVKNCAKKGNSAFRNWTDIFDGRARSGGDKVGPRARRGAWDENRGWLTAIPGLPRPGKIYLGVMKRVELRMQSGEQQNTRWRWTEFSLVIVK